MHVLSVAEPISSAGVLCAPLLYLVSSYIPMNIYDLYPDELLLFALSVSALVFVGWRKSSDLILIWILRIPFTTFVYG